VSGPDAAVSATEASLVCTESASHLDCQGTLTWTIEGKGPGMPQEVAANTSYAVLHEMESCGGDTCLPCDPKFAALEPEPKAEPWQESATWHFVCSQPTYSPWSVKARVSLRVPGGTDGVGWAISGLETRHPLLASDPNERTYRLTVEAPSARTSEHRLALQLTLPVDLHPPLEPSIGWTRDGSTISFVSDQQGWVDVRARQSGYRLLHGGPLIAVGARIDEPYPFHARVGYEVGFTSWLLGAVVAESDLRSEWLVAPSVEFALPMLLILPSFGLGLGVPVLTTPTGTHVGARLQLSAAMPGVAVVFPLDFYPSDNTDFTPNFRAQALLQLSL
jgi:hypothetical protein